MTERQQLIQEAHRELKNEQFAKAIELYRRILLLAPSTAFVQLLGEAEKREQLQFRQALTEAYPTIRAAQLGSIHLLLNDPEERWATEAQNIATTLLGIDGLDEKDRGILRWQRLRASIRSGNYSTLADDFAFLWQASRTLQTAFVDGNTLIGVLAQINNPNAIPVLETISHHMDQPLLQEFLQAKLQELQILRETAQTFRFVEPRVQSKPSHPQIDG